VSSPFDDLPAASPQPAFDEALLSRNTPARANLRQRNSDGDKASHTSLQTRIYSVIQTRRSEFPAEEVQLFGDFSS
jgi:hypothetical protein